jgi:hypothetical protein
MSKFVQSVGTPFACEAIPLPYHGTGRLTLRFEKAGFYVELKTSDVVA